MPDDHDDDRKDNVKKMPTPCRPALAASVLLGLAATAPAARAADAAPAETPSYTLTTNVGLFSQYVFRGVSYTQEKPAVQGGADFAHASGLYVGIWGTNLSSKAIQNAVGEIDVYGGYAASVGDFGYDVGLLQFIFPGGRYTGTDEKYNTLEAYVAVSWKTFKLKYSHALTDYFGFNNTTFGAAGNGNSKGSHYLEANASIDLGAGWALDGHVGRQTVRHYEAYNFTDYRLGVGKDLGQGWRASLAWIGTNADSALYTIDGVDTGDRKWLASIVRSF
jgi:uncharacterized protein (TIGR02001 family)